MNPEEVLVESTGVIGQRIKKVQTGIFLILFFFFICANALIKVSLLVNLLQEELLQALPTLVNSISDSVQQYNLIFFFFLSLSLSLSS